MPKLNADEIMKQEPIEEINIPPEERDDILDK